MTIAQSAWAARGKAVYELAADPSCLAPLSVEEARATVAIRLRASLQSLSESEREAAVAAAARGYLRAHRNKGRLVSVGPASGERPFTLPPIVPPIPMRSVRRNVVSPATLAFVVVRGHPLLKGLTGGRVRVPRGETAIGAVARRIARDTHCEVVAVCEDEAKESDHAGDGRHYLLTVRGRDGLGGAGAIVEAAVRVKL